MLSTKQKIKKILEKVRPFIQSHNGDIELVEIKNGNVIFKIGGACAHCALADLTYNKLVRGLIKEGAPEIKKIFFKK